MKNSIHLLLFVMIAFSACKNADQFIITGQLQNPGDIKRVLLYQSNNLVDSAFLNEKNQFQFIRSGVGPDFYTLIAGRKSFPLAAKNGDEITFNADISNTNELYNINGSEASEKIREFNVLYNKYAALDQSAYARLNVPYVPGLVKDSLKKSIRANIRAFCEEALKFADSNKNNLAGFHAASIVDQTDPTEYEQELIEYAEEIRTIYPDNKAVISFVSRMMSLKAVSIGRMAPEFALTDIRGKLIKLSDYRGKYLLIDFWASWCPPCREESPVLVRIYHSYKNKGFAVLGISLDDQKDAWLKAIKDDRLAWDHVSELKSWEQRWDGTVTTLYKINAIPASFVLDPEGKIVAKNLKGDQLDDFLSKAFQRNNIN